MLRTASLLIRIAAAFTLWLNSPAFATQGIDHKEMEAKFLAAQQELAERMAPVWTAAERSLWSALRFEVLQTDDLIAQAGHSTDGTTRLVTISTGMIQVTENLAATSVHSNTLAAGPCHFDYLLQLNQSVREGWEIYEKGARPEDFYAVDCSCPRFSTYGLLLSDVGKMMTQGGVRLALFFILLHEFAHHVHGDTDQAVQDQDAIELRADAWAIRTGMRARLTFEPVVPTLAFVFLNDDRFKGTGTAEQRFGAIIDEVARSLDPQTGVAKFGADFALQQIEAVRSYAGFFERLRLHSQAGSAKACEPQTAIDYELLLDRAWLHRAGD